MGQFSKRDACKSITEISVRCHRRVAHLYDCWTGISKQMLFATFLPQTVYNKIGNAKSGLFNESVQSIQGRNKLIWETFGIRTWTASGHSVATFKLPKSLGKCRTGNWLFWLQLIALQECLVLLQFWWVKLLDDSIYRKSQGLIKLQKGF